MSQSVDTSTSLSSVAGNVDVSDLPDSVPASYGADATNKPVLQSVSVGTVALSKGHRLHRSATGRIGCGEVLRRCRHRLSCWRENAGNLQVEENALTAGRERATSEFSSRASRTVER